MFSAAFIITIPGIVSGFTFHKVDLLSISSKREFYEVVLSNILVPVFISMLFSLIYDVIRNLQGYWEMVSRVHIFSFPIILILIVVILDAKNFKEYKFTKIAIPVAVASYLLLSIITADLVKKLQQTYPTWIMNITFLYLLPILLIIFYYRSRIIVTD